MVPCFESLGPLAISQVFNQAELTTAFVEKKSLDTLIKLAQDGMIPFVKNLVCFDPIDEATAKAASEKDIKTWNLYDVIEIGRQSEDIVLEEPKPDSVYMFCYTSGTTGDPKGAMLTHSSILCCIGLIDFFK